MLPVAKWALRHFCALLLAAAALAQAGSDAQWSSGDQPVAWLGAQRVHAAGDGRSAALYLPLTGRAGAVVKRGRQLLRAASLPLDGSVREVGYFYATVGLGSPSRTFQLIVDTGSTITYVPCADCKHCGKHKGTPFDPAASKTAQVLKCGAPKCNCGTPSCQCVQDRCFYSRTYAEQSSSDGFLLEDVLQFPDVPSNGANGSAVGGAPQGDVHIVFGCEASESGEIFRQTADGIMGLGNNNNALHSQLVQQGIIADTFSLCFGYPSGGMLLLGDAALSRGADMVYTPLKPSWQTHYYTTVVTAMHVGDTRVDVPQSAYAVGYGSVLDSGTTFTYLPSPVFKIVSQLVSKAMEGSAMARTPGPDPQYNDICWKGGPPDPSKLTNVFPGMRIAFGGDSVLALRPLQYLFSLGGGTYCLGMFDNGGQGTLLGGITVRNVLVQYDRRNGRAGFLPLESCGEVAALIRTADRQPQPGQSSNGSGDGTQGRGGGRGGGAGGAPLPPGSPSPSPPPPSPSRKPPATPPPSPAPKPPAGSRDASGPPAGSSGAAGRKTSPPPGPTAVAAPPGKPAAASDASSPGDSSSPLPTPLDRPGQGLDAGGGVAPSAASSDDGSDYDDDDDDDDHGVGGGAITSPEVAAGAGMMVMDGLRVAHTWLVSIHESLPLLLLAAMLALGGSASAWTYRVQLRAAWHSWLNRMGPAYAAVPALGLDDLIRRPGEGLPGGRQDAIGPLPKMGV